jgi:hypothetical protein
MTIDRHTVAIVSIAGSSLDVLGSLYLAYDLLGGQHGPLRTLTRAVTYGVLYGLGYGLFLGPVFGIATGITHGITLAWELSRTARHGPRPGVLYDLAMSAIRGLGFAAGSAYLFGVTFGVAPALRFGVAFGVLSTIGQTAAYRAGIRPSLDYAPGTRPRTTSRQLLAAVNRTAGYAAGGYLSAWIANERQHALSVGLQTGLVIGLVTASVGTFTPLIEWTADNMPARRMGIIGVCLIILGFGLQSVQYWLALLDVTVG